MCGLLRGEKPSSKKPPHVNWGRFFFGFTEGMPAKPGYLNNSQVLIFSDATLSRRPSRINFLQNLFSPAHRIGDRAHSGRNSPYKIILRQLPSRQDSRRNQNYAFAAFGHERQFRMFACCSLSKLVTGGRRESMRV